MIEVMNPLKMLLKSTGRSEYFLLQDDEYVTAMKRIPPARLLVKSWAGFTLQFDLTKHQQRRGLRPGKVTKLINFRATIMSLTLRYPSLDDQPSGWRITTSQCFAC
jgi:hypothetical protein